MRCAQVIRGLVQRRREVKGRMAGERDPLRRQQLDIRQQVPPCTLPICIPSMLASAPVLHGP